MGLLLGKVTLGMSRLPMTKEEYSKGRGFYGPCMLLLLLMQ